MNHIFFSVVTQPPSKGLAYLATAAMQSLGLKPLRLLDLCSGLSSLGAIRRRLSTALGMMARCYTRYGRPPSR